ncbi:MAG: hypothetical protein GY705_00090 [Bacteroidetes bacterium]|nr:hypothetical protein [Bacteroidota bacterium]
MLKYSWWWILLLLMNTSLYAQKERSFKVIDRHARNTPSEKENDLTSLCEYLIKPSYTEIEKARSLFTWICINIDYDEVAYKNGQKRINKNIRDILDRRQAVCFGYSSLFKALCGKVGLSCEVISGYSKETLTSHPSLEESDHAWNAVFLEGDWYLLDVTWGSSFSNKDNKFIQGEKNGYFLTQPAQFVLNHLPSDPMWQLLDCPISVNQFQQSTDSIKTLIAEKIDTCFYFRDSIRHFSSQPELRKLLLSAKNAYAFNPTAFNEKHFGHTIIDWAGYLTDLADSLEMNDTPIDTLLFWRNGIIQTYEKGAALAELYNWQKENHAYAYMNYSVLLSKQSRDALRDKNDSHKINTQKEIIIHLEKAKNILKDLPSNFIIQQALQQCEINLEVSRKRLNRYRRNSK